MNIAVLIVASTTLMALAAHTAVGTRETASIEPREGGKLVTAWVQAMCAFQMLSVDLLAVSLLLFAIGIWDLGPAEGLIVQLLSGLYLMWGVVWVVQLRWLNRPAATLLGLPHWTVWFLCSGLLFFLG